jgi:hypothetical protein
LSPARNNNFAHGWRLAAFVVVTTGKLKPNIADSEKGESKAMRGPHPPVFTKIDLFREIR